MSEETIRKAGREGFEKWQNTLETKRGATIAAYLKAKLPSATDEQRKVINLQLRKDWGLDAPKPRASNGNGAGPGIEVKGRLKDAVTMLQGLPKEVQAKLEASIKAEYESARALESVNAAWKTLGAYYGEALAEHVEKARTVLDKAKAKVAKDAAE